MTDEELLDDTGDWLTEITLAVAMVAVRKQFNAQDWRLAMGHAFGWKMGFIEGVMYRMLLDTTLVEAALRNPERDN